MAEMTQNVSKKRTRSSDVWEHFVHIESDDPENSKAQCKYCQQILAANTKKNGTSSLWKHLKVCKKHVTNLDSNQRKLPFTKKEEGQCSSSNKPTFSQMGARECIARMIIKDELPMRMVEWQGFRELLQFFRNDFVMPSRRTIGRNIEKMYKKEKEKLKAYFKERNQRVCLTTDTWTSAQNKCYMVMTAHWIDEEWNFQKKIINFCEIFDHKGETIGSLMEQCLLGWEIDKVLTVKVDNASSNDVAISYLVRNVRNWDGLVLNGEHMHVRCFAHILNLIVSDGLKEHHNSIVRVRNAVKYVKSSPQRLRLFKSCIDNVKITFKGNVTLDVPTRWNSTYLMLDNAEKYAVAFDEMKECDNTYATVMQEEGHPTSTDWNNIRLFVKFLKAFYDSTIKVSKSLSITAHQYVTEACNLNMVIDEYTNSNNVSLMSMAFGMVTKLKKYWGHFDKMNTFLFVAVLLDPRGKTKFLKHCISILMEPDKADQYVKATENVLERLYLQYKGDSANDVEILNDINIANPSNEVDIVYVQFYDNSMERFANSELEEYLSERAEKFAPNFDLLRWWKLMRHKYPVLSRIAKDIFSIPISIVLSESAFSCGGRVIDSSRTALLPETVEAIICTQSWILNRTQSHLHTLQPTNDYETIDEAINGYEKDDEEGDDLLA